MKDFTPTGPILTPPQAAEMYARAFEPIPWSERLDKLIISAYREVKADWMHVDGRDGVWNNPKTFRTKPIRGKARTARKGQCNDFVFVLMEKLIHEGLDPDALRAVVCDIVQRNGGRNQPHMVLAILTTEGTHICCNIRGCWALMSPEWDNETIVYEWHMMEGPGRSGWVDLRHRGLDDVLEMIG